MARTRSPFAGDVSDRKTKRRRRRADAEHREIALPYEKAPRGWCKLCGEQVLVDDDLIAHLKPWQVDYYAGRFGQPTKRSWHEKCAQLKRLSWPGELRRKTWERDHGKCAKCGTKWPTKRSAWDADHIVPLKDGGTFDLGNVQTLCRKPCHRDKTAAEATLRAERRGAG